MSYTYALGVVAHHQRKPLAVKLGDDTGAAVVHFDYGTLGGRANHIATIEYLYDYTRAPWLVILEDDAILVPNFPLEANRALMTAPTEVVSFYLGRGKPQHWQSSIQRVIADDSVSWLKADHLLHGVGYALRREIIPDLLDGYPGLHLTPDVPIDEGITHWMVHNHIQASYTRPSLVDHADTPSLNPDPDWVPAKFLYVDSAPDPETPFSDERKAWIVGTRIWDSTFRTIPTPETLELK